MAGKGFICGIFSGRVDAEFSQSEGKAWPWMNWPASTSTPTTIGTLSDAVISPLAVAVCNYPHVTENGSVNNRCLVSHDQYLHVTPIRHWTLPSPSCPCLVTLTFHSTFTHDLILHCEPLDKAVAELSQ